MMILSQAKGTQGKRVSYAEYFESQGGIHAPMPGASYACGQSLVGFHSRDSLRLKDPNSEWRHKPSSGVSNDTTYHLARAKALHNQALRALRTMRKPNLP